MEQASKDFIIFVSTNVMGLSAGFTSMLRVKSKVNPLITTSWLFFNQFDRFQRLELKHVEDRGCFPAIEFR